MIGHAETYSAGMCMDAIIFRSSPEKAAPFSFVFEQNGKIAREMSCIWVKGGETLG